MNNVDAKRIIYEIINNLITLFCIFLYEAKAINGTIITANPNNAIYNTFIPVNDSIAISDDKPPAHTTSIHLIRSSKSHTQFCQL